MPDFVGDIHPPAAVPAPAPRQENPMNAWVDATMRRMSLEEKIGQLFVATVWGKSADEANPANRKNYGVDTPAQVVQRYGVGGVIYFDNSETDNVESPRQLAAFSNGLQRAALDSGAHLPLLVSIDQEGGRVTRMAAPATEFPDAMAVGAGRDAGAAGRLATILGQELRQVGVNQDFAPVADVNSNPANPVIGIRSFAGRPELSSQLVSAEVTGLQSSVAAAAKHFPGHGDAAEDSHTGLPLITRSADQWRAIDAPPFKAAISAGVDAIMTAHIQFPSLDPSKEPATLSQPILTGLLRNELGYDGLVITDSLRMEGVRKLHSDAEVPVLALKAGVDQLLMPPNLALARDSVLKAVRSGELSEQRIDQSVARVLRLKWTRGVTKNPIVDPNPVVGTQANRAQAQQIADNAITVLRNDGGALPARGARRVLVAGWSQSGVDELTKRLAARGRETTPLATGTEPSDTQIAGATDAAHGSDLVVVLTNNLAGNPEQRRLVDALVAAGKPVVAVANGVPYDAGYTGARTWVATYGYRPLVFESLAKVLLGELSPRGRLPVDVPAGGRVRYPFGTGLSW